MVFLLNFAKQDFLLEIKAATVRRNPIYSLFETYSEIITLRIMTYLVWNLELKACNWNASDKSWITTPVIKKSKGHFIFVQKQNISRIYFLCDWTTKQLDKNMKII